MSQSLSVIYLHVTFSTRGRSPWINEHIQKHLHAYMASTMKNIDCPALIINSMPDHVHMLFRMSKTNALASIIEEVKKSSSKWIKNQPDGSSLFYWQRGYGAFSVCRSHVNTVARYISNQKDHHKKVTYREEVERLMEKNGVEEYDPQYYWD
jgi:REP element-mobilizing transposase RayT